MLQRLNRDVRDGVNSYYYRQEQTYKHFFFSCLFLAAFPHAAVGGVNTAGMQDMYMTPITKTGIHILYSHRHVLFVSFSGWFPLYRTQ